MIGGHDLALAMANINKAADRVIRDSSSFSASWPDERVLEATLQTIREKVRAAKLTRTALILVGPVLAGEAGAESSLYAATHRHLFRPG